MGAGHWHLVLQRQELQDPGGWRCLHLHHHCCSLHQVCCEEAEGDEGGLNAVLVILITSPQLARICQNCGADSVPQYFLFYNVPRKITPAAISEKKKKKKKKKPRAGLKKKKKKKKKK